MKSTRYTSATLVGLGLLALGAVTAGGCSSSPASSSGCRTEADCQLDEVCQAGACVPIAGDSGTGGTAGADGGGACIGKQGDPTSGLDCACPSDCDSVEHCLTEVELGAPGGLCARSCSNLGGPCPGNQLCIELAPGDPSTSTCFRPCQQTSDCPTGDVCQTLAPGGPLICGPLCQADSDCSTVGKCNAYTGTCGDVANPSKGDIGAPCQSNAECISEFCVTAAQFPGGYCTAFCSLSRQGCPNGSFCTPNWSDVGDMGLCFQTCEDVSTCRSGYKCGAFPQFPNDKVCGP